MSRICLALLVGTTLAGMVAFGAPKAGPVTFQKDVLPVLQQKCQICHRPGEVAPMSLLTYENARPWAKSIKAAVISGKMPPWFADPAVGHFSNERRLTDAERDILVKWVDNGSPEGNVKDAPAPVHFPEGWKIGTPDFVAEMTEDIQIPATGIVKTNGVYLKVNFPKDTWVQAAEIRPGNAAVVHHMKAWVIYPGSSAQMNQGRGGRRGNSGDEMEGGSGREILCKYNPGLDGQEFTVGDAGKFIPAGSDIYFETHYTSNGKATTDRSKVGIVYAKTPPQNRMYTSGALTNHRFTIPAGDPAWELKTEVVVQDNVQLTWLQPHMHLRGKDYEVRAIYPTGETQTLLKVPHFDFNWQVGYEFAKPVLLPKGTILESVAHFDNSANNPFNPDPARNVPYGGQTWDEMSVAFFSVIIDPKSNPDKLFKDMTKYETAKPASSDGSKLPQQ